MSKPDLKDTISDRLKARKQGQRAFDKATSESRVARMRSDANAFHRFFIQLTLAVIWVWHYILRPVGHFFKSIAKWFFLQYRKLWSLAVYRRDTFGTLRLSKTRAGLFLTATLVFIWGVIGIAGFVYDATLYLTTSQHDEVLYLTNSQEVDAEANVHSVKGCESLPCSDTDSLYFRITPSAFNHVWSLVHTGSVFYPDYVGAAVPPGLNKCTISSYGIRIKFLMRGMDLYPELLKASCTPVPTVEAPK